MTSPSETSISSLLGSAPVLGDALEDLHLHFGPGEAPPAAAQGKHLFHTFKARGLVVLAAFSAGHSYNLALLRADGAAFTEEEILVWLARNPSGLDGWTLDPATRSTARRWTSCDPYSVIEWSADQRRITAAARRAVEPVSRGLSSWDRAGHYHLRLSWKTPRPEV